jgi:hypothetical protein
VNRAQRRRLAKQVPKAFRKELARRLKPPPAAEVAQANLERMGMQIVEAKQLLKTEGRS